jgi:hypothetical protein
LLASCRIPQLQLLAARPKMSRFQIVGRTRHTTL